MSSSSRYVPAGGSATKQSRWTSNALGLVALIIAAGAAITTSVVRVALTYAQVTSEVSTNRSLLTALQWGLTSIDFIASIIALILGLMALRQRGSPLVPGIAIGISAISIVGTLMSLLSWLMLSFGAN